MNIIDYTPYEQTTTAAPYEPRSIAIKIDGKELDVDLSDVYVQGWKDGFDAGFKAGKGAGNE